MARKSSDEIRVTVVQELVVSERAWRALMAQHGRDMTGVVVPAHIQKSARTILKREFERLGFPQPQIKE